MSADAAGKSACATSLHPNICEKYGLDALPERPLLGASKLPLRQIDCYAHQSLELVEFSEKGLAQLMGSAPSTLRQYSAQPSAIVESDLIGPRTRIWAFAHVLPTAQIGADCNICDHTLIEDGTVIRDRVTVKCYVEVTEGVTLEDDVFVGPNVGFTNDRFPRSRQWPAEYARTLVKRGASIGANASILPGLTIGSKAMIGAGAVVTRDVPARAIVIGNPGFVKGYVDATDSAPGRIEGHHRDSPTPLAGGAALVELPYVQDARGLLSFAQIEDSLPFPVIRYFLVYGVPNRKIRGEHAHKALHQFLVCVSGNCAVRMFDGHKSDEVRLDRPELGLHIPPMVWTTQYKFSSDAVLLVLASDIYRDTDYIRDPDEYLTLKGKANGQQPSDPHDFPPG
jgi:UDP-2-acetamido-3-amino-2,3-dideoxy-glucuronate N-acetyltransferase